MVERKGDYALGAQVCAEWRVRIHVVELKTVPRYHAHTNGPPLPRTHDSSQSQLDSIASPDGGRRANKSGRQRVYSLPAW